MLPYLIDWLSLLARWLHFITGIAWIGSSFYFVWLDNHLLPPKDPKDDEKGVGGELWSVHGGGFYHSLKYRVSPQQLPESLHWFKWEAYTTWMSGMFLLALVYWYGAEIYLVDATVQALSAPLAVGIAGAFIIGGWLIYDLMCKSKLGGSEPSLAVGLLLLVVAVAWGLCQLFSGRGAYIHFGAVLGTIMVANVFFVIIPGQRRMVDAAAAGRLPDASDGIKAKQRSVHNTYFTLPVLFVMISNHYALTYAHQYNWLVLVAISVAGALIRIYFVLRHKGNPSVVPLVIAIVILLGVAGAVAPMDRQPAEGEVTNAVTLADIRTVITARCTSCHSATPTFAAYAAAPAGMMLDDDAQILTAAESIYQQTVVSRVMPIGNLTQITEAERGLIDRWYRTIAEVKPQ